MTGLLGFVTLVIISTQYKSNKFLNVYLLILFFLLSARFLISGFNELNPASILKNKVSDYSPFLVVIFPCVYLYFHKLIINQKRFEFVEIKHFILPVFLGLSNVFVHEPAVYLNYVYNIIFSAIALYYIYCSYNELKNGIWITETKISVFEKQYVLLKNWTFLIFIICILSVVRLLVCLYVDLFLGIQSYGSNYLWVTAIFSCILFFKVLLTPEILFGYHLLNDKLNEKRTAEFVFGEFWIVSNEIKIDNIQDSKLKQKVEEQLSLYIRDMEAIAFNQNWFRDSSISLGDFSSKLGVPKSHITYVFKYHSKISFIDFKKMVRIYDSVRLIEKDYLKSNTLDSLAKEVGFSSYNPFFTSFKEIVGMVPQEYNKQIKQF
ncbi:helix-turn-helix domain-containing protein [Flavobacterium ovatum]|uniref:helix-turn-helix domain-containing protein n=1 Tax=Flavobacterium ovatum TaxID=1928857 RepID=UPI003450F32D